MSGFERMVNRTRPGSRYLLRVAVVVFALVACAPRAGSLKGTPAPARFPNTELPRGNQRIVFRWEYVDQALAAKGEGVARVASPDSVRMDFYLDAGLGGGYAIVIGDSISTPGGDQVRRYLPPVALLWAALGRLAVPALPDTVAKVDEGALRADIGRNPAWRVTFVGDRLSRLERIVDGRRLEWVSRDGADIRYQNERSSRSLTLKISSSNEAPPFDPAIWRR
jgi:hypothetical protein